MPPASERLVLIPAINKRNTTGYKNVAYDRSKMKFQAQVQDGGQHVRLGCFDTAEEAATAYARSEYGRADAAKLLQPRATTTAAGAAAILQAAREGLTLTASSSSNSGYRGVTFKPKERGSKKYELSVKVGRKDVHLGYFATAEQAALFYARREAGRDTSDLTAPPPPPPPPEPSSAAGAEAVRQAEREGLTLVTSSSSNSGYRGVTFKPKKQGSKKYELTVRFGGRQNFLGLFATAEQAALFYARREAGRDTSDLTAPPPPPPPPEPSSAAGAEAVRQAEREGLTLVTSSSSNSGYRGVTFKPKKQGSKKYELTVRFGGRQNFLGLFATAEQAALFYARREAGRDTSDLTAPPPPPPPPEPSSAAGAEAVRQAEREGLTLVTSSSSNSGYRGVVFCPKKRSSKKYQLRVTVGGKKVFLGSFATAEQAALFYARREAGRDTSDLTAPPPPPPPPEPSYAAGAEAVRQAGR